MKDSGNSFRFIGYKVYGGASDVVGGQNFAQGHAGEARPDTALSRLAMPQVLTQHGCIRDAGTDAIHADAIASQVERERFCKKSDGPFRGRINGRANLAGEASDGSRIENCAFAVPSHMGNDVLGSEEARFDVDRHDAIPLLFAHFFYGLHEENAGVVEEDVDPAPSLRGVFHGLPDVGLVGDVYACEVSFAALGADGCDSLLSSALIPVQDRYPRSFAGKSDGACPANSAGGACHDGHSSGELHGYGKYGCGAEAVKLKFPWVNKFNFLDSISAVAG
jgi:hypothetical protein